MKNLIDDQPKRELVQPVAAERLGIVEREALRLDVAVAGAERAPASPCGSVAGWMRCVFS